MTGPTHDRLRDSIQRAAQQVSLDPLGPATIQQRATRRRRRRVAAVGGTSVAVVALVGAVVANRDVGGDTLELGNPPDTTEAGHDVADPTVPATTPPTTPPITTPPTLPPVDTPSADDTVLDVGTASIEATDFAQLVPWRDGFLRIGYQYPAQPLGPLPDEVVALFPDEVLALFPDGIPATIDEAIDVLAEAGMLDEVTEILSEHPEASEAIYGEEPPPPTPQASFTVDGVEWSPVELTMPTESFGQITTSGDRLVVWSIDGERFDDPGGPRSLTVAWTDDLVTWQSSTAQLGNADADTDDHIRTEVFANSVAVLGDRWLTVVERHSWVDYEALLPDDVRLQLQQGEGYGLGTNDDGIELELSVTDGEPTTMTFTWEELGLDGNPEPRDALETSEPVLLAGTFGGDTEELPLPGGVMFSQVFAGTDAFYLLGEQVLASDDGRTWTEIPGLTSEPGGPHVQSVVPVSGGDLFVGQATTQAAAWLRDTDGNVTEAQLPELPDRYHLWSDGGSGAWIVEVGDPVDESNWEPVTVVVEHDGFVLELVDGPDPSLTVTDAATGEVVWEMSGDPEEAPFDIYEIDEENQTASIVVRDEAGDEIVRVPDEVLSAAFEAAYADVEPPEAVEWQPDLWLLATADGVDWLTLDLADPVDDPEAGEVGEVGFWPQAAAVNNGSVLYPTPDGWVLAPLPTGS